ncbi:MAG: hypothetical protein LBU41_05365, partial [Clostridiales Family XIII bacterium]|nr:hypothetical protein [Clostridiales Family XIII bacterium]
TLVRFEVKDLEICEMPHDTLVRVRRRWSLAAMMCLPFAFAFPLFFTEVHAGTLAYATLARENTPNITQYLTEDQINTALILTLLLLAELIVIRIRLFWRKPLR